jgi:hypothetical protein
MFVPPKDRRVGLVALAFQCGFHLGAQHGRKSAPTYPINRGLMAFAAETACRRLWATEREDGVFNRSDDRRLSRHADFLRHILCLLQASYLAGGESRAMAVRPKEKYDDIAERFVALCWAHGKQKTSLAEAIAEAGGAKSKKSAMGLLTFYENGERAPADIMAPDAPFRTIARELGMTRPALVGWLADGAEFFVAPFYMERIRDFRESKDEQLGRANSLGWWRQPGKPPKEKPRTPTPARPPR